MFVIVNKNGLLFVGCLLKETEMSSKCGFLTIRTLKKNVFVLLTG